MTLGNFLKPLATINLLKSTQFFVNVSKSMIFLMKSFLGNFYRHLVIFSGHTDLNDRESVVGKVKEDRLCMFR